MGVLYCAIVRVWPLHALRAVPAYFPDDGAAGRDDDVTENYGKHDESTKTVQSCLAAIPVRLLQARLLCAGCVPGG